MLISHDIYWTLHLRGCQSLSLLHAYNCESHPWSWAAITAFIVSCTRFMFVLYSILIETFTKRLYLSIACWNSKCNYKFDRSSFFNDLYFAFRSLFILGWCLFRLSLSSSIPLLRSQLYYQRSLKAQTHFVFLIFLTHLSRSFHFRRILSIQSQLVLKFGRHLMYELSFIDI